MNMVFLAYLQGIFEVFKSILYFSVYCRKFVIFCNINFDEIYALKF